MTRGTTMLDKKQIEGVRLPDGWEYWAVLKTFIELRSPYWLQGEVTGPLLIPSDEGDPLVYWRHQIGLLGELCGTVLDVEYRAMYRNEDTGFVHIIYEVKVKR